MIDHSMNRGYSLSDVERAYCEGWAEAIEKFAEKIRAYSGEHYIDCDGYGCKTDLVFMTDAFLEDIVEQLNEQNK